VTAAAGSGLRPARAAPIDLAARRLVLRALAHIGAGELIIVEGSQRHRFGTGGDAGRLRATVLVHSPHFYRGLLGGSLGAARSYIAGDWDCDDLVALTRIASLNMDAVDRWGSRAAPLVDPARRAVRWFGRNTRRRSRDNVSRHYDLSDDLFALMLDDTMAYSCAVFESPGASLRDASVAKFERVCDKLDLGPGDEVLEIGSGWGGFAIHAATRYGCRVTTTTVSRDQHRLATERVRVAGLADRVTVLLSDYRDLHGRFDKLVSIEMIEAVGWQYFDAFFARCSRLLRPKGAMLVQAITIAHRLYLSGRSSAGFTNTVIFPGGCLPSIEAMVGSTASRGHHPPLPRDAAVVAGEPRRPAGGGDVARLRRALLAHLDALPLVLRGRLPGASHPRRAAALRQTRLSRRAAAGAAVSRRQVRVRDRGRPRRRRRRLVMTEGGPP